ncbi:MAG: pyridoxamine 5'-phosphate oxidase family protein [Eubacterium sp.]|nr:pyridoxamine 5'-phosphate oxidase family protein [Eubacterium sp.]
MTRRELEITDLGEIKKILETCKVLHLGLVDDGNPYIVPMNFGYTFEEGKLVLFLHSGVKGYKLEVMKKNPTCCFEMECDVTPFAGKVSCQYGMAYSSIIGRGEVEIITDPKEKIGMMTTFMKSQTGKDFEFNERLVSIVTMMKIEVSEYTAKHRPIPEAMR